LSNFSDVSWSSPPEGVGVVLRGTETELRFEGDVDLVDGALTAIESAVEAAVETDVWDPVRSKDAARRGRDAGAAGELALRLMRAASWFNEGRRAPEDGRSDLGASELAGGDAAVVVIVKDGEKDARVSAVLY